MSKEVWIVLLSSAIFYGTPLVYAATGEILAERAGILNLGVEGMMLMGAVVGFWAEQMGKGPTWWVLLVAVGAAALAGTLTALIHAILVITFRANQIVSGLALTIFAGAAGLSSYIGSIGANGGLGGQPANHSFQPLAVPGLSAIPVIGPAIFKQNALVYASWLLVALAMLYLYRTRIGLHLRAVGESPQTADAMGVNVTLYRYVHTLLGGALAGIGGVFFTLAISTSWIEGLTAGAGWIAVALVIFAFWRPELAVVGAYLFGWLSSLTYVLQTYHINLPVEVFSSLPYIMTVIVLVIVSNGWARRRLGAPAALGVPYFREER
jgi:ABC-type uncharacterized transport system permease subunit